MREGEEEKKRKSGRKEKEEGDRGCSERPQ